MSRLMSVAVTEQAVRERRKTVTRRLGWQFLKPGDRLTLCRKVQGRKPGEPLVRLAEVEVVSVRREPLAAMTDHDVSLEAVPDSNFAQFWGNGTPTVTAWVIWFSGKFGIGLYDNVTRIEWRYL